MHKDQGYRSGFDRDDFTAKGSPNRGKIGPGRSLYNDERYGNRDRFIEDVEDRVWDLEEMHVNHPEGQTLIGDEKFGKGPKGYKRSDEKIFEDVCETLKSSSRVDASDISVFVEKGLVLLTGTVHDREMKKVAERLIDNVLGVEDVRNELNIQ